MKFPPVLSAVVVWAFCAWTVSSQPSTSANNNSNSSHTTGSKCVLHPTTNVRDALLNVLSMKPSLVQLKLAFGNGDKKSAQNPRRKETDAKSDVISRLESDLHLFRPALWQRSTSRQGRSLLMLGDNFDILSLRLLSMRVESLSVTLTQQPLGCLDNMTSSAIKDHLLNLLLNDFQVDGEFDISEQWNTSFSVEF